MKTIYFALILFISSFFNTSFSQSKKIINILNKELRKEVKSQFKSPYFNGDTIQIINEFSIDKNNILTLKIKKQNSEANVHQIITQEVSLLKIQEIAKDINILFLTEKNAVTTTLESTENKETTKENMFYLFLYLEKFNERLGNKIQSIFNKAGYKIEKKYWYD